MVDTSSESPASAPPPRDFGDYQLLRRLGQGAMAEVYLAEQISLKRQVAVKILKAERSSDEKYIRRFRNEAQSAASLVHANIVQIHDVGCHNGFHYIAQEFVEGVNLKQLLEKHGPLEVPGAVNVMRQVAAALSKAAQSGIVHRDIKPENIMLAKSGEVKVADFGLARVAEDDVGLTQVGITLGTPLYMSPEQAEGSTLDPRSDIYSFGITCYEMLCGRPPFRADSALSVAVQHLNREPKPLAERRADVPDELCQIVHKMLAKDPDQRFPSGLELLRALREMTEASDDDWVWPEEMLVASGEFTPLGTRPMSAATAQLQAVMNTERRRSLLRLAAIGLAILFGLALGIGLTDYLRGPDLLAGVEGDAQPVERQSTALSQYLLAANRGTEQAWLSVLDYFPDEANRYLGWRTKQQLARYYLARDQLDDALRYFDELAGLGETEKELVAFGLAGRCVVLSLQGEYEESADVLNDLAPLRESLPPDIRRVLAHAVKRNRQAMNPQSASDWDRWLAQREEETL